MKDCKGRILKAGDEVIYVHGKNNDASLATGKVTKFYKGAYGKDECSVDSSAHIRSNRIMKLKDSEYEIYTVEAEMYNCNEEYLPNAKAFKLYWTANVGFGELTFVYDTIKEQWGFDSEYMGKDFCLAVLNKWLEDLKV